MEAVAAIQEAAAGATSWSEIARRLWVLVRDGASELQWHALAFDCALAGDRADDADRGIVLSCLPFQGATSPTEAPPEALRAWRAGLLVSEPLARARYGDLLWTYDRDVTAARTAIAGYVAAADLPRVTSVTSTIGLSRAVQLAAQINDKPLVCEAADRALLKAQQSLVGGAHEPGIPLRLVSSLARLPKPLQPSGIDDILAQMERRYDAEPPVLDGVADLIVRRSDDATGSEARRRQIDRWVRWRDSEGGAIRLFALRKALEIAQVSGLRPEIERLRSQLQEIRHHDLDLKELSYGIDIEKDRVERELEAIVGTDSFNDFLARLAVGFGPPAGDLEANERLVKGLMREYPLQFIFPKTILGPEDTRLRHVVGDDEHLAVEIIEQEARSIGWFAHLAAEALDRAFVRYGPVDVAAVATFFEGEVMDPVMARRLARAVELHSQADFDSAAHVIAPRLERAIRAIARASGILVVREPAGDRPGGVRGLNELLPDLVGFLPESWRRYLFNLLAEPLGMNLRNRTGHGLIDEARREDSAILIHAASWLSMLAPETPRK